MGGTSRDKKHYGCSGFREVMFSSTESNDVFSRRQQNDACIRLEDKRMNIHLGVYSQVDILTIIFRLIESAAGVFGYRKKEFVEPFLIIFDKLCFIS